MIDEQGAKCSALHNLHRTGAHRTSQHYPGFIMLGSAAGTWYYLMYIRSQQLTTPFLHYVQNWKACHNPKSTSTPLWLFQKCVGFLVFNMDEVHGQTWSFSRKSLCIAKLLGYSARKGMVAYPVMSEPCQQMAVTPHCVLTVAPYTRNLVFGREGLMYLCLDSEGNLYGV